MNRLAFFLRCKKAALVHILCTWGCKVALRKPKADDRMRVGRVSYYRHHGGWHVYYLDGAQQVRRRAGDTEQAAAQVAAQINGQLAAAPPTLFSFAPLPVPELRRSILDHHEQVQASSLATVARYATATRHFENVAARHLGNMSS